MKLLTVDYTSIRDKCIADARVDRAHWRANHPVSYDDALDYIKICSWPVEVSYWTLAPSTGLGAIVCAALVGAVMAWML